MTLTVKGQAINQTQVGVARALLQVAQQVSAPPLAANACIFDAIFESDLGLVLGPNSAGYGGVLGGATAIFGDVHSSLVAMATSFFEGGNGFQAGGATAASGKYQDVAIIGSQVTAAIPFDSRGISTQYESQTSPSWTIQNAVKEAAAIVQAYGAGTLAGGTFGAGGTGTSPNQVSASLWTVGDPSNPDQDYWTTFNQVTMSAQMYCFSDAESLFVADGIELMAQQPAAVISRMDPSVIHADVVYDNCLAVDTPIPTPGGWTTMGDLAVGDMVFGSNGRPTAVLRVSRVFTGRDCYRVRFSDGTSIVSDDSHLWETVALRRDGATEREIAHQRYLGRRSTKQIRDTLRVSGGRKQPDGALNHRVKVAAPLELPKRRLPIDPYVFGSWLGDGTSTTALITVGDEDRQHLCGELVRAGYRIVSLTPRRSEWGSGWGVRFANDAGHLDGIEARLKQMGVRGNKHVPVDYLRASPAQRLALLQGLMDTDGSVTKYCCFCVANERLAQNVLEIARSLGFRPKWSEKAARGTSKRQYQVTFATRPHLNPFRLPRKARKYADRVTGKAHSNGTHWRTITAIEPTASVAVRCIEVDAADHLFLAGEGMTPTSNTAFQYASTHTKKGHIQRRTSLARITSPTMVSLTVICDIDKYRAGDTVYLALFGPADGVWLIGDCTRSIYSPASQLTLVQAMQPINAASGLPGGPQFLTGKQASQPTSGTVIAAMISEATTINNDHYPYVHEGGRQQAGTPDVGKPGGPGYDGHTVGFDCSGSVAAVLEAGGLWSGSAYNIVADMLASGKLALGQGVGQPECTIYEDPTHMYMRINGVAWGTGDGRGHGATDGQTGPGWLGGAVDGGGTYQSYHVPQAILGQQAAAGSGTVSASGYVNPFQQATGLVPHRIDDGVDYAMNVGSPILAIGNVQVILIQQWGGAAGTQPIMIMKFLDGNHQGKFYYLAEQITPAAQFGYSGSPVTPNITVPAGAVIANYAASGTAIETGWASGSSVTTLAQANGHGGEAPSPEGSDFNNFLVSLGAPSGT